MKKLIYIIIAMAVMAAVVLGYFLLGNTSADYIFLITLDTTRADFVRYTIPGNKLTPNLARLAQQGIHYENAYSLIPITLPSHSNMFYSLPPHQLKIYNNGAPRKIAKPSLPQYLFKKGYETGAVISLGVVKKEFGMGKGFVHYYENFRPFFWYKTAAEVNRDTFELLEKTKNKEKAFYWLHYSDPHEPYYPPTFGGKFSIDLNNNNIFVCKSTEQPLVDMKLELKPGKNIIALSNEVPKQVFKSRKTDIGYFTYQNFSITPDNNSQDLEIKLPKWRKTSVKNKVNYYSKAEKSQLELINKSNKNIKIKLKFLYRMLERPHSRKSLYRKQIRYLDNQLGKLFDHLKKTGIYDKSVFIIMGDHGEGLGEYNKHYGHIHYLNKIYTHVPLIIFGKGIKERGAKKELVSTLDIAPTILDIAGIKKPNFMYGASLLKPYEQKKLLLETYSPEAYFDAFSIIDFPYQILFYPGRTEGQIEFIDLTKDLWGINNITNNKTNGKIKADLMNAIKKVSRALTAAKGKIGKVSKRHRDILDSLGYL